MHIDSNMNQANKTILLTGGAGFIGSNLIPLLLDNGFRVHTIDNLSTGKLENLKHFKTHANFTFIEGDIRNQETVDAALQNVNAIIHLAAQIDVTSSVKDPLQTHETNVTGTLNLLEEATKHKIKKFIFSSRQHYCKQPLLLAPLG